MDLDVEDAVLWGQNSVLFCTRVEAAISLGKVRSIFQGGGGKLFLAPS
jgi:hypothetical protein